MPSFLNDTIKAQGLAWSIYRAGLNGKVDSSANAIAATLIDQKHHPMTQLGAAHFFARSAEDYSKYFPVLANVAIQDASADVRMAATLALRKIKTDAAAQSIKKILENEENINIKINAVRALQNFPFEDVKSLLYKSLYDKNSNIGIATSEVVKPLATEKNWIELSNLTGRIQHWRIQANLYEASLSATENKALIDEVITLYRQSFSPYQKAALITALQSSVSSYDFIEQELTTTENSVIRASAASALAAMTGNKKFNEKLRLRFADLCQRIMPDGDVAVIGTLAGVLANPTLEYRTLIKDFNFLHESRKKLSLPKDNEALQPLEAAIAHFEHRKTVPVKNEFNNPIDWDLVKKIPTDQKVIVKTSRGHITLRLLVEEAPGSVANFVKLARDKYYDKKYFHRVVPNFVAQAGCNRGDGWGGENYSIRSEFGHTRYKTGSVGMASAGKDTEGTQWFITHSPTPHLDGRYSIFAEVVEGMDVVNFIEVGDQILSVEVVE
jgi:cyclophilin family peptidyl-prolyl cis-trans isomerase